MIKQKASNPPAIAICKLTVRAGVETAVRISVSGAFKFDTGIVALMSRPLELVCNSSVVLADTAETSSKGVNEFGGVDAVVCAPNELELANVATFADDEVEDKVNVVVVVVVPALDGSGDTTVIVVVEGGVAVVLVDENVNVDVDVVDDISARVEPIDD
jgi:hypothetical protein